MVRSSPSLSPISSAGTRFVKAQERPIAAGAGRVNGTGVGNWRAVVVIQDELMLTIYDQPHTLCVICEGRLEKGLAGYDRIDSSVSLNLTRVHRTQPT